MTDYIGSRPASPDARHTRADYLAGSVDHHTYYLQFSTLSSRDRVVRAIGESRLRASTDPHMNDIPLAEWDRLRVTPLVDEKMRAVGDYPTAAGMVCLNKAAARQWLADNPVDTKTDAVRETADAYPVKAVHAFLLKRRYRFFSDPSHAWLRVPMADIVALGIEDTISRYSYVRDAIAYLEEDADATAFVAAYTAACGRRPAISEADSANRPSCIRGYVEWTRHNSLLNAEIRRQRDKQTNALPVFETRLAKIQEGSGQYDKPIRSTVDACETLPALLGAYFVDRLDCEEFAIVTLDTKHRPTSVVRITRGTLDASLVHPREVFRAAIAASASAIILVHNHPSGDTTPSREDIAVTDKLTECGKMLGITVLDHVVIGGNGATSVREAA